MVETAESFFDLYFDIESRDLPLLITLIGTRNGVAETLRLLSLFDKDYQKLWKPVDVRVYHDTEHEQVWNTDRVKIYLTLIHNMLLKIQQDK